MNTPNPYAPPKAAVRDVPDPGAQTELAGRFIRLVAHILDSIILGAMVETPLIITGAFAGLASVRDPRAALAQFFGIGGLLALLAFIAWIWLTVLFVSRNGQTIAKKLLGIKVVRTDGSKASLGRIFWLRNVVNVVLTVVIPFIYWLADLLFIFGESRQCLHDKIADTMVVKA